MLIHIKSCLEKGMETKFKDLKAKHLSFTEAKWKLRDALQQRASQLVNEYMDSLELPAKMWGDSNGASHNYVQVGKINAAGDFEALPYPRLDLDEKYLMNFVIATTLNDDPMRGGAMHCINVSLWYDYVSLRAAVGSGDYMSTFSVSPNPGGFYEVCGAIKQLISIAIDKAMPSGVIVGQQ